MKEEAEKVLEEYRKYQHGTIGIDVWEEGAFRAGWNAAVISERERIIQLIEDEIKTLKGLFEKIDVSKTHTRSTAQGSIDSLQTILELLSPTSKLVTNDKLRTLDRY